MNECFKAKLAVHSSALPTFIPISNARVSNPNSVYMRAAHALNGHTDNLKS